MEDSLNIGFLCYHNPLDRRSFSGTPYFMYEALKNTPGVKAQLLGHHRKPGFLTDLSQRFLRPKPVTIDDVNEAAPDVIIGLIPPRLFSRFGTELKVPLVHVADATPRFLREFYDGDFPAEEDKNEAAVIAASFLVVYSSEYMAKRARKEFSEAITSQQITHIPFGANFDDLPVSFTPKQPFGPVELLFVGRDWIRKGGEPAVAAVEALAGMGIEARLSVVGCEPENLKQHPLVNLVGYLDKNNSRDVATLERLFRDTHILILPTKADCTPMVVAEANAFSCPVLISDTGGIGSLMQTGVNGAMLPLEASGTEYAKVICELVSDRTVYDRLCASSFRHYQKKLTWRAWAEAMKSTLDEHRKARLPQENV